MENEKHTYVFTVKVDGGAAFQEKKTFSVVSSDYCKAEDEVFERLRKDYSNVVAFFKVINWRRI